MSDLNAARKRRAGNDPAHGHCPACGLLNVICRLTDCKRGTGVTERRIDKPVVVLDRIEPGVTPDYCCHGRATCIACPEWVWLGHETFKLVESGEALPICQPCAVRLVPRGSKPIARIEDHRRADGPHE